MTLTPLALEVPANRVVLKVRERQRGAHQYQRQNDRGERIEIQEGPARFLVNLTDYLDTGLFLDHRLLRARLSALAKGRDFLNLFCYTGTATVQAALGGARSTTSVDLSATYLRWAADHLALNDLPDSRHSLIQADGRVWPLTCRARFGLILLDPPSFSNSKRMSDTLDIQRDHVGLIQAAADCLTTDGILIFSTHLRRFQLDRAGLPGLQIRDIGRETLPKDFERHPESRHCYEIRWA
ncbi:fused 23S rRNA m(2)G2445 methyltransferase and 23S rRNA m(7)G2069 methyltransferase (fragment) [Gammaproteobacteria bacterium]